LDAFRRYDLRHLHYEGQGGVLIPALQQAQARDGYISSKGIREIHRSTGIPLAQIYGVATFYAQFRLRPVGKHMVRICHGTACHVSGATGISKSVRDLLKVEDGETTPDRLFTVETVSCVGCCSLAPVMVVDQSTYGNLKSTAVRRILKGYADGPGGDRP
jgi:NADH-quinone oxidoreductase subunit E